MLSRFGYRICRIDSALHHPYSPEQMGRISSEMAPLSLQRVESNNVQTFLASREKCQSHACMHVYVESFQLVFR